MLDFIAFAILAFLVGYAARVKDRLDKLTFDSGWRAKQGAEDATALRELWEHHRTAEWRFGNHDRRLKQVETNRAEWLEPIAN